ncbi:MAG: hypothetical protein R2710_21745 [Acidimicrobiales bacterium]
MVGAEAEFGEGGASVGDGDTGGLDEAAEELGCVIEAGSLLIDATDDDGSAEPLGAGGERPIAEKCVEQGALARTVRPRDQHPITGIDLERDRTETEAPLLDHGVTQFGNEVARPFDAADLEVELPWLPGFVDDLEPLDGSLGASGPGGKLFGSLDLGLAEELVAVARILLGLGHAGGGPLPLGPGSVGELGSLADIVRVLLLGMAFGDRSGLEVSLPPSAIDGRGEGVGIELDHGRDHSVEEARRGRRA